MSRKLGSAVLALAILVTAACGRAEADPVVVRSQGRPAATSDPCAKLDKECWEAHIAAKAAHARLVRQRQNERAWWAEVVRQQVFRRDMDRLAAWLRANPSYRPGQCGGSLPPCWVMRRESGGDIRIWNGGCYAPVGWRGRVAPNCPGAQSSASGKWQAIRGSWGGYGGYVNAADAPERVQDEWARKLYRGGAGGSHWGI